MEKVRDYKVDGAKALLVGLVILGHFTQVFAHDAPSLTYVSSFIYLFHMPALAFFSGYVINDVRKTAKSSASAFLPLYFAFSILFASASSLLLHVPFNYLEILNPGYTWYLLTLVYWRAFLPSASRMRRGLPVFFAFGLLIGCIAPVTSFLSLSRAVAFFPFFFLGFRLHKKGFAKKLERVPAIVFVLAPVIVGAVAYWWLRYSGLPVDLLMSATSYKLSGVTLVQGLLGRSIIYLCTFLMILFFLRVLPKKPTYLSRMGLYSLSSYLLHIYFILAVRSLDLAWTGALWQKAMIFVYPTILLMLLSTKWATKVVTFIGDVTRRGFEMLVGLGPARPEDHS